MLSCGTGACFYFFPLLGGDMRVHAVRLAAAAMLAGLPVVPAWASTVSLLFERDAGGTAGNELALVTFPDFDALVNNTTSLTQFTQIDIDPAFSIGGAWFDGQYRLLFERDAGGTAGNELAVVSFPDLDALVDNTSSFTQFSQVDVDPAFSVGGVVQDSQFRLLFERDAGGTAGNELAVVSFPDLDALVNNTSSFTQFTQIDIDPAFSVAGAWFDGQYRLLFERDAGGTAGNELAVVSFPDFDALVNNTSSFTQFTQIDIDPAFSVAGVFFTPDVMAPVPVPPGALLLASGLVSLLGLRRRPTRQP